MIKRKMDNDCHGPRRIPKYTIAQLPDLAHFSLPTTFKQSGKVYICNIYVRIGVKAFIFALFLTV
jgi:hypothetical protein